MKCLVKQINYKERTIEGWASRIEPDRDNDVIIPKGIQTESFSKNPVLMSSHDYHRSPLGEVTYLYKKPDEGLYFKAKLGTHKEAQDTLDMINQMGFVGVSIGFLPIKSSKMTAGMVRDELGVDIGELDTYKNLRVISKLNLLEISLVRVPSCPDCVVTRKSKKHSLKHLCSSYCGIDLFEIDESYKKLADDYDGDGLEEWEEQYEDDDEVDFLAEPEEDDGEENGCECEQDEAEILDEYIGMLVSEVKQKILKERGLLLPDERGVAMYYNTEDYFIGRD